MLCYNCMREKGDAVVCPFCGAENLPDSATHHLPAGTVIGGRYTLGRVLGEGGFGITYIGFDHVLDTLVAVKEYFPYGYSHRVNTVSNAVTVSAGDNIDYFEKGKRRFLSEAKNVARFRNEPGIVIVTDFIEENNTAYIIMEYLDGIDLRNYLRQYGVMTVDQAMTLLLPVIKSLNKMHDAGIIHRDISPDNLMYLKDGSVKLMDFGAARDYVVDNRSMSVMLKKGYAPEEQYRSNGKQGPWTDVYGMCATFYRCITGKTPVESLDRIFEDPLKKPSELGVKIKPEIERVLMYGLAVRKEDRCQNMAELRRLLLEARDKQPSAPQPAKPAAPVNRPPSANQPAAARYAQPVNQAKPAYQQPVNRAQPVNQQAAVQRPVAMQNNRYPAQNQAPPVQKPVNNQAVNRPYNNYPPVNTQPPKKSSMKAPIIIGVIAGILVVSIIALLIILPFTCTGGGTNTSSASSSFSISIPSGISSYISSSSSSPSSSYTPSSSSAPSSSRSSSTASSQSTSGNGAAYKFTVAESNTAAKNFQKSVNYLFDQLDLSVYEFDINGTDMFPLSENGCYKTNTDKDFFTTDIEHSEGAAYNCDTTVTIEGKTYTVGTSTLKNFLDDGWAYADNQEAPKPNTSSSQGIDLVKNNKFFRVYVSNTGSDPKTAKIRSYYLDGPGGYSSNYASFDFLGLTESETVEDILVDFKTPSHIHMYSGNSLNVMEFTYNTTDSNYTVTVEFGYHPDTNKSELRSLNLAYRD